MKNIIVPHDFLDDPKSNEGVVIMPYHSDKPSLKTRITLQYNMFSLLLEGEKSVYYADNKIEINPSQFLLLSTGNCLMSEKLASDNGSYRSILLFFDNKVLSEFFIKYPSSITEQTSGDLDRSLIVFQKDPFLYNFIESLRIMLDSGQKLNRKLQQLKLEELLLYISGKYPGQIMALRDISREADEETMIRQTMMTNENSHITVEELAFLCNMSLSTFKRRFDKIYGTTPSKWLLQQRMKKAANLLKQGDFKASEIYYDLGYENLSSFIQSFKQVHGLTPKQYQLSN
ncbi:AraC family transcriptional regulator [Fulvivirga ulvae]|uniref:helix-turn-helix domain-containing protein n=1 Tax=Fulvivirga ulvae TaxID=2904245 RepID=UPI001F214300|nr:AraC family transcriptional regulator [Fulvivirga ulvae]UII31708.1 AraC family transcriptional regulator [Fulvivirga ulvae]